MPELHISSLKEADSAWRTRVFVPHPLFANEHMMTIFPGFLPRGLGKFLKTGHPRLFQICPEAALLGYCHFQAEPRNRDTVIVLHGLEGSAESSHVQGISYKAFNRGFNVIRLNMRNCGGSMKHSSTLYNAGMYQDLHAVMEILHKDCGLKNFMLVGYSLGGNMILNAAALAQENSACRLKAVCAVSPSIDLSHAVKAIEKPHNRIYQDWFLRTLKEKIVAKSRQYPDIYKHDKLKLVESIRDFDDHYTAPHGGYGTADRYYSQASALSRLKDIQTPTLIITSEDDPLVPVDSFYQFRNSSSFIELLITEKGGHGGFFQKDYEHESDYDNYWAENRVVDYLREVSSN